ncbi:thioredoxin domain-containing protein [Streptomyces sp. NPDC048717]|uniref:DsbA family protein n=1 Tax=unclassified Streptomyces TaxID=2593676 RepID=UPI00342C824C
MSEKNRDGMRSARERLKQQREQDKTREKRRRVLIVSAAVVGVLGLAGVVGVIAAAGGGGDSSDKAGPIVPPAGATAGDKPAIPQGRPDAPSTLAVWEDFRCPACAQFESIMRTSVHQLMASGALKVDYHLATLIDGNLGGTGSLRAANAAACAQDAGKFTAYHDVLYSNQPPETNDAFAKNEKLIELAAKVPGLDTPAFRACVEDGTHDSWVKTSHAAFKKSEFRGTPSVLLNGKPVFPQKDGVQISPENLKKWVAEANKGKKAGTASPAPGSPEH